MRGLSKRFGPVHAVRGATFAAHAGEVTALLGENGAGKSTVISLVSGANAPDGGVITIDGSDHARLTPRQAAALGIAAIRQEPVLVDTLSVAENLGLAAPPTRGRILADRRRQLARAAEWLEAVGAAIDPRREVGDLSPAERQMVEIARSRGSGGRILFFDEPTAALSPDETARLFTLIRGLCAEGAAVVYVSHRLEEIFALCDRAVVMRDGSVVADAAVRDLDEPALVRAMAGTALLAQEQPRTAARRASSRVALKLTRLGSAGRLRNVDLEVRAGEVHGIAGIVGAGRSRLLRTIAGAEPRDAGTMAIDGRPYRPRSPRDGLAAGVALVPEDRRRDGLFDQLGQATNVVFGRLRAVSRGPLLTGAAEVRGAAPLLTRLDVRPRAPRQPGGALSGGNQQKLVVGRALFAGARVLLLDEPTKGVDVGAKADIHRLVDDVARDGTAVLLVSSDMRELTALADRISVLARGELVGTFEPPFDRERLIAAATGAGAPTTAERVS